MTAAPQHCNNGYLRAPGNPANNLLRNDLRRGATQYITLMDNGIPHKQRKLQLDRPLTSIRGFALNYREIERITRILESHEEKEGKKEEGKGSFIRR